MPTDGVPGDPIGPRRAAGGGGWRRIGRGRRIALEIEAVDGDGDDRRRRRARRARQSQTCDQPDRGRRSGRAAPETSGVPRPTASSSAVSGRNPARNAARSTPSSGRISTSRRTSFCQPTASTESAPVATSQEDPVADPQSPPHARAHLDPHDATHHPPHGAAGGIAYGERDRKDRALDRAGRGRSGTASSPARSALACPRRLPDPVHHRRRSGAAFGTTPAQ